MIAFVEHDPEESFPDLVEFADPECSWEVFKQLEAFADGFGTWRFLPGPGRTILEQDDGLMNDLMKWRWLAGIARRQHDKEEHG